MTKLLMDQRIIGRQKRRWRRPPSTSIAFMPTTTTTTKQPRHIIKHYILALTIIILTNINSNINIIVVNAQDQDSFFCGTNWDDASSNCPQREHCPNASNEECTTVGHICFADTLCSASGGDGEMFKYAYLMNYLTVEYEDKSNTKFCGTWWVEAEKACSLDTHCSVDSDCNQEIDEYCVPETPNCNILDLFEEEHGQDWKETIQHQIDVLSGKEVEDDNGGDGDGGISGYIGPRLDQTDPKRNNYCGSTWGDASLKCQTFCGGGEDTDCPVGLKCFAQTTCYYDDDLVPTGSPVISSSPTMRPTPSPIVTASPTDHPIVYDDPANSQFCGHSWSEAIQKCSIDTHCTSNKDCTSGNEQCHSYLPGCNYVDMKQAKWDAENPSAPASAPASNSAAKPTNQGSYFYQHNFCGETYEIAEQTCSLETHCGETHTCSGSLICHYVTSCSFSELLDEVIVDPDANINDDDNSEETTEEPNVATSAHDPTNFMFCGKDWDDAVENCSLDTHCPNRKCANGYSCFNYIDQYAGVEDCNAYTMTRPPSPPTDRPTTPKTSPPTPFHTTAPTPRHDGLCAESFEDLQQIYRVAKECSDISHCDAGHSCFFNFDVTAVGLCAGSLDELQHMYRIAEECSDTSHCDEGHECFFNVDLASFVQTKLPTAPPTPEPITPMPTSTSEPTHQTSLQESTTNSAVTTSLPTLKLTPSPVSEGPTNGSSSEPTHLAVTSMPTEMTTATRPPISNRPTNYPSSLEPTTHSPINKPTQLPISAQPTRSPFRLHEITSPQLDWEVETDPPSSTPELMNSIIQQNERQFYCASTVEDLESASSCDSAVPCTSPSACPPAQGCLEYDCKQQQQQSQQSTTGWNYLPDRCPFGFIGLKSLDDQDCTRYHECDNMYIGTIHGCESGFRFANNYGKCISEELVAGQDCNGQNQAGESWTENDTHISQPDHAVTSQSEEEEEDQIGVTSSENHDLSLCPQEFVGFRTSRDCTKAYECNDGYLGVVFTCENGLKFDKIRGECISENFVDGDCHGPALDVNINQPPGPVVEESASGNDFVTQLNSVTETEKDQQTTENETYLENETTETDDSEEVLLINYDPDLCLLGFVGFRSNRDCTKYYECNDGFVGAVHTCKDRFKLDRQRGHCISSELVDSYCYGPSLETTIEPDQLHSPIVEISVIISPSPTSSPLSDVQDDAPFGGSDSSNFRKPTLHPTTGVRPMASSDKKGGDFEQDNTALPTTAPQSNDGHWLWLIPDDINEGMSVRPIKSYFCALTLLPFIWVR